MLYLLKVYAYFLSISFVKCVYEGRVKPGIKVRIIVMNYLSLAIDRGRWQWRSCQGYLHSRPWRGKWHKSPWHNESILKFVAYVFNNQFFKFNQFIVAAPKHCFNIFLVIKVHITISSKENLIITGLQTIGMYTI